MASPAYNPFGIVTDAAKTSAAFEFASVAIVNRVSATVTTYGYMLQRTVKAKASGRPGPRVQTGDYRRAIGLRFSGRASVAQGAHGARSGVTTATVGTNEPQGRRLERGFMGMTDSLGRLYHQPPYPHFGPAFDEVSPKFNAAVDADVAAVLVAVATIDRALGR